MTKHPNLLPLCVYGFVTAVLAVVMFASGTDNDNDNQDNSGADHTDSNTYLAGLAVNLDPVIGNKTLDFLNNFVCKYELNKEADATDVFIDGYCHPRLSAVPHHRTQQVSILPTTSNSDQSRDDGIAKGEVVMRLPRPLQIWDLDALRDTFIQEELLGLGPNDSSDADMIDQKRLVARHKDTQNPLDSGAFLAVYLIRLLHGSRDGTASSDTDNDGQCQYGSGECKSTPQWGNFEQHRERISLLSEYLDILPTVDDRLAKSSSSHINPNGHPIFWADTILQSLFPRYTPTYDLITLYQQMIKSEYAALKKVSEGFGDNVNYLEYLSMRINVLSRAFGVPASVNDSGLLLGTSDDAKGGSIVEEMMLYETSNFGSSLDDAGILDAKELAELKLRSMCPLLDMYNSHPNPNVSWRYDSKTSSYVVRASRKDDIPPGHPIMVSYGKYTNGHLFAKYGYVNGDGSSPTEISLAVFHRMLGDVGLGRQYSQLPFDLWDPNHRDEIFSWLPPEKGPMDITKRISLLSARRALKMQNKELLRYIMFDDGYRECIDVTSSSGSKDEVLKLLKLQHLVHIANYREAWVVRVPPNFPDARPFQTSGSTEYDEEEKRIPVAINANRIVSICRLLSLKVDDIAGDAIDFLRVGLASYEASTTSSEPFFLVEKHEDELEYRAMMCVVRLCNAALGRYLGYDNSEPELVGTRQWNAWYVMSTETRAMGILVKTAAGEANRLKRLYQASKGHIAAIDESMTVRAEGACPLNYSLPLLSML